MVSTSILIYIGYFLSAWGDRMWLFAIPLFLLDLDPKSLTLTAGYGLVLASSVLIFGPLIGDWIDRRPRLYCARMSLVIQNCAVILCAFILIFEGDKSSQYILFVKIAAVVLGAIALLASTGAAIIIQKDWIVVLAGDDKEMLTSLNCTTRRIDLLCKILAPAACGQIMSLLNLKGGAIFIMSWNGISMFVEYFLLKLIYKRTPALSKKQSKTASKNDKMSLQKVNDTESLSDNNDDQQDDDQSDTAVLIRNGSGGSSPNWHSNPKELREEIVSGGDDALNDRKRKDDENKSAVTKLARSDFRESTKAVRKFNIRTGLSQMFEVFITLKDGWKLYISQPIALACIGFSFLYMTLLGFGYITLAYVYSQCLSEFSVGLMTAGAGVTGIAATFMYPLMRKRFGFVNTGIASAVFQLLTLIPCIVSVFVIGSPFYLLPQNQVNLTTETMTTASILNNSISVTDVSPALTSTTSSVSSQLFLKCLDGVEPPASYLSLILLMAGMVLARIGLWGFDLTITQLIQESVAEPVRGTFSGVQSSLNNLMDLLTYIFVFAFPLPSQFGFLVLISAAFVTVGYILFFIYVHKSKHSSFTILPAA